MATFVADAAVKARPRRSTPTGVIGSPSQATAAKGSSALDHLGRNVDTLIELLTTR
ncbi:hypothetical protein [Mycobacterium sp.]|uniref:hypothetical protein n=1 Tax=Mycobacterium sp. TaxID=1785 RepID=UPI0025DEBD8D|nr:hypothetical protein [Mycobacterium sp.]